MSRKQKLPRSKAKTAWGLLQDVKRVMLAEPKRVNMGFYLDTFPPSKGTPSCGTVGCVAGWIVQLAGERTRAIETGFEDVATELLGTTCRDTGSLFDSYGYDLSGEQGTLRYARSVVRRINRFMQAHAAILKAEKIPSGGRHAS